ncbi:hypothetical protein TNCV_2127021 [Trichonephila clavipes]|nr:hypothetical protein TNCV_2127021 [Trichonephila clavipes]
MIMTNLLFLELVSSYVKVLMLAKSVRALVSECILTLHYSAARGILVMNLVILYQGQVMRMTPELAPLSFQYHITPMGECLSSRHFWRALLPYTAGLQWYWAPTHDTPATIRYPDHLATATSCRDHIIHVNVEREECQLRCGPRF